MVRTKRELSEWTCQGCGFTLQSHLRNRLYCSYDCWLLYRMAKSSIGCTICGCKDPNHIWYWPTPELRAEAERLGLVFAKEHQHCRRAKIDSIGRLTACWCAACTRARGEELKRNSSGSRELGRVITPAYRENRKRVLERSDWMCEICALPIDRNASSFDDRSPTPDHIIPLRDGGTDDLENLRAAYRWCNLRRESGFGDDQEIFEDARTRFQNIGDG
ncbi:HNH endonuclease [Arthrobacter sp. MDT1-65]